MINILGTPGAGKTTQTKLLAEYLNCPWFSMGDLIRQKATGQDRKDMLAGKIIDDDVTMRFVGEALATIDASKQCVFEGNPRRIPQVNWWLAQVKAGHLNISGVIHLVADPLVAEVRLDKRGRLDDFDDDVVEKRFAEYNRFITPTLDYLKKNNIPVYEIDANGTIKEEFNLIKQALGI